MRDQPTCVDLFCGAGGFSFGFHEAGFRTVAAADRSESALETYQHNLPGVNTVQVDLGSVSPSRFCELAGIDPVDVDVVIGGPPCKGFSHAGKMDPDDPRNSLVGNYITLVEYLSPTTVVMENVTGILHMEDGKFKERIVGAFRNAGYKIPDEPDVLSAADYGIPQLRDRVIFFATKDGSIDPPAPTHYDPQNESSSGPCPEREPYISIEDAICDLSYLGPGQKSSRYELVAVSEYQREMRANSGTLHNHKASDHGATVQERFALLDPGQQIGDLPEEYQTAKHSLKRWHPEGPAPTVTTLPEDFVHYSRTRIPTVRELARIQSFPDDFVFKGPRTTGGKRRRHTTPQYTQVGNAVPPKLAKAIAEKVYAHLT